MAGGADLGFTTIPNALRAAGKAAGEAVEALRGADCGSPVADLVEALPGGETTGAASSFAKVWKSTFTAWCEDAERHAIALTQAADTYSATEHTNASNFSGNASKITEPR
jgi:hypothetical protein